MWGYIGRTPTNPKKRSLPSLYVRVYRVQICQLVRRQCSLIICEGISQHNSREVNRMRFPHYMWGYIGILRFRCLNIQVPSLYVRVYRMSERNGLPIMSSLIICEGISHITGKIILQRLFPHYMWGYIEFFSGTLKEREVPSLYVRVYRSSKYCCSFRLCSLIICEGISLSW